MQNKFFRAVCAFTLLFSSFYTTPLFAETAPFIVITEIAAFEASDTEWVEIYNVGSTSVDITGWKFFEEQTNHGLSLFRGTSTVIAGGESAVIANKAENFAQKYPAYTGTIFDSSWGSLKEEGEEIGLKDKSGAIIELFTYPASQSQTSLERIDTVRSGSEAANWRNHPQSHSLGALTAIAPPNTNSDEGTTTQSIDPQSEATATIEPASSEPAATAPTPPPPQSTQISNAAPQAMIEIQSGPLTAQNSITINFDGRASTDPNGDLLTYIWDMGDGTVETAANPGPHTYNKPGIYVARLTVIDPAGLTSEMHKYINVLMAPEPAIAPTPKASTNAAAPKIIAAAQPTLSSAPQENKTTRETVSLNSLLTLPDTELQLRGYFVFIPSASVSTKTVKKSTSTTAKTKKTKSTAIKTAKTAPKKSYSDGDLSAAIEITEIFPAPSNDDGEEWVEIYNSGGVPVNLGNWQLTDSGKQKSPFRIQDTVVLGANKYRIFQKSETKIALNNGGDSLELRDFEDTIIDSATYEKAQTGSAYARVAIEGKNEWQWVSQPTPGAPNPAFTKIRGVVKEVRIEPENESLSAIDIELPTGTSTTVYFSGNTLDPLIAQVTMKKGTSVDLLTNMRNDGMYTLQEISGIKPPAAAEEKQQSINPWFVWLALAGSAAAWYALRRVRKAYFRKAQNEKPEIAEAEPQFFQAPP